MSNKLARFRVLVAADARFRGGDKRDHSDDSSTDEGPSEAFTRGASAIVTIVPFVPGDGSAGKAKTPLNQGLIQIQLAFEAVLVTKGTIVTIGRSPSILRPATPARVSSSQQ